MKNRGANSQEVISKYKLGKTSWVICLIDGKYYRVYKNGEMFDTQQGNDFETLTEAEVNILLEYLVKDIL